MQENDITNSLELSNRSRELHLNGLCNCGPWVQLHWSSLGDRKSVLCHGTIHENPMSILFNSSNDIIHDWHTQGHRSHSSLVLCPKSSICSMRWRLHPMHQLFCNPHCMQQQHNLPFHHYFCTPITSCTSPIRLQLRVTPHPPIPLLYGSLHIQSSNSTLQHIWSNYVIDVQPLSFFLMESLRFHPLSPHCLVLRFSMHAPTSEQATKAGSPAWVIERVGKVVVVCLLIALHPLHPKDPSKGWSRPPLAYPIVCPRISPTCVGSVLQSMWYQHVVDCWHASTLVTTHHLIPKKPPQSLFSFIWYMLLVHHIIPINGWRRKIMSQSQEVLQFVQPMLLNSFTY